MQFAVQVVQLESDPRRPPNVWVECLTSGLRAARWTYVTNARWWYALPLLWKARYSQKSVLVIAHIKGTFVLHAWQLHGNAELAHPAASR